MLHVKNVSQLFNGRHCLESQVWNPRSVISAPKFVFDVIIIMEMCKCPIYQDILTAQCNVKMYICIYISFVVCLCRLVFVGL